MKTLTNDHPAIIAPPPLIYLGFLGLGLYLEWLWPTQIFTGPGVAAVGLLMLIVGVTGVTMAVRTVLRAESTVDPYQSPTTIVTWGLYRFSRNPIYLFDTLIYIGLAMAFSAFWAFALMPVLIWALQLGVVAREEQYLASRFGETYRRYQQGVRRWF